METGGISRRLVEFAKSIVGRAGRPAVTCVLTCMIFAAVSGSSATTFAIGAILIPALIKHGYSPATRQRCRPPAPSWA